MHVYSLTRLTGRRKNVDRTIVVATVEVNRATFVVVVGSALVSIVPAVIVGALLGAFALAVPALFIGAGLILVDQRTRKGLQLRRYEAMWDKRKTKVIRGTVFVCGEPLRVPHIVTMVPTVLTAPVHAVGDAAVIAATIARNPVTPKVRALR